MFDSANLSGNQKNKKENLFADLKKLTAYAPAPAKVPATDLASALDIKELFKNFNKKKKKNNDLFADLKKLIPDT